jgi:hypothetical protein
MDYHHQLNDTHDGTSPSTPPSRPSKASFRVKAAADHFTSPEVLQGGLRGDGYARDIEALQDARRVAALKEQRCVSRHSISTHERLLRRVRLTVLATLRPPSRSRPLLRDLRDWGATEGRRLTCRAFQLRRPYHPPLLNRQSTSRVSVSRIMGVNRMGMVWPTRGRTVTSEWGR